MYSLDDDEREQLLDQFCQLTEMVNEIADLLEKKFRRGEPIIGSADVGHDWFRHDF